MARQDMMSCIILRPGMGFPGRATIGIKDSDFYTGLFYNLMDKYPVLPPAPDECPARSAINASHKSDTFRFGEFDETERYPFMDCCLLWRSSRYGPEDEATALLDDRSLFKKDDPRVEPQSGSYRACKRSAIPLWIAASE